LKIISLPIYEKRLHIFENLQEKRDRFWSKKYLAQTEDLEKVQSGGLIFSEV